MEKEDVILEEVAADTIDTYGKLVVELIHFHKEYAIECGFDGLDEENYDIADALKHNGDYGYLHYLLKHKNDIIGILTLNIDSEIVYINKLFIKEDYRGRGYAKNIIRTLSKRYSKLSLKCYYNLPAEKLYKSLGFKQQYVYYIKE